MPRQEPPGHEEQEGEGQESQEVLGVGHEGQVHECQQTYRREGRVFPRHHVAVAVAEAGGGEEEREAGRREYKCVVWRVIKPTRGSGYVNLVRCMIARHDDCSSFSPVAGHLKPLEDRLDSSHQSLEGFHAEVSFLARRNFPEKGAFSTGRAQDTVRAEKRLGALIELHPRLR